MSGNKGSVSRSRSGDFVDARNLAGEDFVSKTLEETIGTLGVVTRPKVVDFSARLKERRKANARVVAMRACVSDAVIVVAGALVWLFFFSSVFRLESGIAVFPALDGSTMRRLIFRRRCGTIRTRT